VYQRTTAITRVRVSARISDLTHLSFLSSFS
jgi:hypothetical protein